MSTPDLHIQLVNLTLLLRFSILLNQEYSYHKPLRISKTPVLENVNSHPLEAVTAILVTKNEVVAACYTSKATSIQSRSPPATDMDASLNDILLILRKNTIP